MNLVRGRVHLGLLDELHIKIALLQTNKQISRYLEQKLDQVLEERSVEEIEVEVQDDVFEIALVLQELLHEG